MEEHIGCSHVVVIIIEGSVSKQRVQTKQCIPTTQAMNHSDSLSLQYHPH
jgi:hypothetical protein